MVVCSRFLGVVGFGRFYTSGCYAFESLENTIL
jgi:hypothetical protein